MPEISRRSIRAALRQQEAAGEILSFQPGGWIELATVEDETSPFPEAERLTLERLEWLAEAVNACPECPAIRSNWQSPDPTIGAHEAVALPPLGFIEAARVAGPILWGRVVEVVRDGVGQVSEAIRQGYRRRSLGFLAGNDPQAPKQWGVDHLALLGAQASGQAWLGMPDLDPAMLRARPVPVSTRALEALDEPEPADPAEEAEGGPAAEEEWTMDPEQLKALFAEFLGSMKSMLDEALPARAPEPTPEERAAAEAPAEDAAERSAWHADVETRVDRCFLDRKLSATDRAHWEKELKARSRKDGEPTLAEIERRAPLPGQPEPLHTVALSARTRSALDHLPAGVRIEDTNIARTLSYAVILEELGVKPGQQLTPEQAHQVMAIRRREAEVSSR